MVKVAVTDVVVAVNNSEFDEIEEINELDTNALAEVSPVLKTRARDFRTKKSLGQNFLVSEGYVNLISDYISEGAEYNNVSQLLEIGPGIGFLTDTFLAKEIQTTVVDFDKQALDSIPASMYLKKIHKDILQFDFEEITDPYMIVGNLPFNIATKLVTNIIGEFWSSEWNVKNVPEMILMFQLEVAERLTAEVDSKSYNPLSLLMQAKAKTEYLFTVPNTCFWPQPKVHAGVIRVQPQANPLLDGMSTDEKKELYKIIKIAFSQRRKTISNSLKPFVSAGDLESIDINPSLRPQNLSLENFLNIYKLYKK